VLFEDVESFLHFPDFQLNRERRRLDGINRAHDNLKVRQLLDVSIQVESQHLKEKKSFQEMLVQLPKPSSHLEIGVHCHHLDGRPVRQHIAQGVPPLNGVLDNCLNQGT
jgi:hypothetical protein